MTPYALLNFIIDLCAQSPIVAAYTIRTVDLDVLRLRVHLIDESFIQVFYNHATAKFAFALIVNGQRIYGKDNKAAYVRWCKILLTAKEEADEPNFPKPHYLQSQYYGR